jgi:hypothetical protein
MYTFSSKLKFSIILMALGLLNWYVFTAPKDIQEVEKILALKSHGGHGRLSMKLLLMVLRRMR